MTNALATLDQFDTIQRVAKAMTASGYFSDARDIAQAVVKIQAGAELGLPPFAAMSGIHIIKGKPAMGANLIATLVKNDPRYDYRVNEHTATVCKITFYENGEVVGVSSFTADEAKKAGTQNMHKFPKNMLFARAMSNGAKWYTPGIFGGTPVYTPEELGAIVDEDGDIIQGEVVDPQQRPSISVKSNGVIVADNDIQVVDKSTGEVVAAREHDFRVGQQVVVRGNTEDRAAVVVGFVNGSSVVVDVEGIDKNLTLPYGDLVDAAQYAIDEAEYQKSQMTADEEFELLPRAAEQGAFSE